MRFRLVSDSCVFVFRCSETPDVHDVEEKYYADGENAFDMRKRFRKPKGNEKGGGVEGKKPAG